MPYKKSKFHIIWWWIAGLSAALYLIQEGKIDWKQIIIYDKAKKFWWALDWKYSEKADWYVMRWLRVFEEKVYSCMGDLMSRVPALKKQNKTVKDKFIKFNEKNNVIFESRLIKNKKVLDARPLKISVKNRLKLSSLLLIPESTLHNKKISEYFSPDFYESNFWYEFCTVFGFTPENSLIEFKRYVTRFLHCSKYYDNLDPAIITPLNQYESVILPILDWLKEEGVNFEPETKITNVDFETVNNMKKIVKIYLKKDPNNKEKEITVKKDDYVFMTIWSMVSNASLWTMKEAPIKNIEKKSVAWTLWENIAKWNPEFWNPANFCSNVEKTAWTSFTITFKDPSIKKLLEKYIHEEKTIFWWTTIVDSNWFISLWFYMKPYFINQDKDITIWWWYVLYPERKWNYVKKKIGECNWEEILTEVIYHLWFEDKLKEIIDTSICIPCYTPYITSQLMPKKVTDKPLVVPNNSLNFAFIWQFCEIPNDIAFTVEYSIRSAQIAVYKLLNLDKQVTPIYKWQFNPKVVYEAVKTLLR